ncbi:hypothetical protein NMY22_g12032 [Coprinellus aureogranulatus]|nr:hypothetical protein NMY22_g12032 [Coprinellus aureogranulatus]
MAPSLSPLPPPIRHIPPKCGPLTTLLVVGGVLNAITASAPAIKTNFSFARRREQHPPFSTYVTAASSIPPTSA